MAKQKEYKILINGIKESIEGVGTLQDSLDRLAKTVSESGGHFKTASSSMDELAKTEQKISEYNKEYQTALAANKAVLADNAKSIKQQLDLEKANLIVQENLQDTYAQKQQLLTALGKVIKNTTGDTSDLKAQYAALNQELKDFDAELGNHQRNVGDYTQASRDLKGELKAMQTELANMLANGIDKADPAFVELAQKAGALKDAIGDAGEEVKRFASDTKKLDDVINIAQSATAAFELYKGAMSAFGMETEEAEKAMQKLMGAMSIIQSLKTLQESLSQNSATARLFAKGMDMLKVSTEGATTATKLFKVALASIGIGLVIGLIAELVAHWDELTEKLGFATKAQEAANEAINAGISAYAKGKAELTAYTAKLEKFNGTKEQEKQIVDELNKKYGDAFGHYNTLAQWKDVLKQKTDAYCQSLLLEAQMQAKVNQLTQAYENVAKAKKEFDRIKEGDLTYWEQIKGFFSPGSAISNARETFNDARNGAAELEAGIEELAQKIAEHNLENGLFQGGGSGGTSKTVKAVKEQVDQVKKIYADWIKSQISLENELEKERQRAFENEKKRIEALKKLKDKYGEAEFKYQKAVLENELEYAETEEDKLKIKEKILKLEEEQEKLVAKRAAADAMGMTVEQLQTRIDTVEGRWVGLNDEQKQVLQTLLTQLSTIETAADTAKKKLSGGSSSGSSSSNASSKSSGGNQFLDFNPMEGLDLEKIGNTISDAYDAYAAPIVEGLGDSIHMMMEFAIEEAEEALEEAEQMHDEAVEKVSESKDRLSELNDKMRESSGAQLEQYKQQMADEMLLLQQREQEERRLEKEKQKREKELEKEKKRQRKLELQQQLVQAIVSGALAVVNGLATQPFVPVGIAMGALAGAATAIQIATITKQLSKMADGGLLQGRSHAQGGIPVGNTGIEVEGGEYIVNKRSTAKFLPLLQQLNEDGARHKTLANQIGKFANGGQLNYQRIDDNFNQLSTTKAITSAIGNIEMHPVVSVVDINRAQRDYTAVRQLAGANQ